MYSTLHVYRLQNRDESIHPVCTLSRIHVHAFVSKNVRSYVSLNVKYQSITIALLINMDKNDIFRFCKRLFMAHKIST